MGPPAAGLAELPDSYGVKLLILALVAQKKLSPSLHYDERRMSKFDGAVVIHLIHSSSIHLDIPPKKRKVQLCYVSM